MNRLLSIVVPVFNEEPHLRLVLAELMAVKYPIATEWILVDDHSTDGSREILQELQTTYGFKLVLQPSNQGKGTAVARGFKEAQGDLIMIQDADFEYDPGDVPALLVPLLENRADVVYGSRFKTNCPQVHRTFHRLINRMLTSLSNFFSQIYLSDMETCYKLGRADLFKSMRLRSKRFGVEVEITAYLAKTSARLFELPIHYYPRNYLQGKKITWKDGLAALYHLVNFNWFTSREKAFDRLPERYQSRSLRPLGLQEVRV